MVYLARIARKNKIVWICWWIILVCTLWRISRRSDYQFEKYGGEVGDQLIVRPSHDISQSTTSSPQRANALLRRKNIFSPRIIKERGSLKQQLTREERIRLTAEEIRKIKEEKAMTKKILSAKRIEAYRARYKAYLQLKKYLISSPRPDTHVPLHVSANEEDEEANDLASMTEMEPNSDHDQLSSVRGSATGKFEDIVKLRHLHPREIQINDRTSVNTNKNEERISSNENINPPNDQRAVIAFNPPTQSLLKIPGIFQPQPRPDSSEEHSTALRKLLSLEDNIIALRNKIQREDLLSLERQDPRSIPVSPPKLLSHHNFNQQTEPGNKVASAEDKINEEPKPKTNTVKSMKKKVSKSRVKKPVEGFELIDPKFSTNLNKKRQLMKFLIHPRIPDSPACDSEMQCFKTIGIKLTLVFIVQIAPKEVERRQLVRTTMNSIEYVDGIRFMNFFIMGRAPREIDNPKIPEEAAEYGDIIQYDAVDVYSLLNVKSATSLQWASQNLPDDYIVAKIDADVTRNFSEIVRFYTDEVRTVIARMTSQPEKEASEEASVSEEAGSENVEEDSTPFYKVIKSEAIKNMPIVCCISTFIDRRPTLDASSKWYVPKTMYALNAWPIMCIGQFYAMPVSLATEIVEMSRVTRMIYLEDVWTTGIIRRKLDKGDLNIRKNSPKLGTHLGRNEKWKINPIISSSYNVQMLDLRKRCLCTNQNAKPVITKGTPTIAIHVGKQLISQKLNQQIQTDDHEPQLSADKV